MTRPGFLGVLFFIILVIYMKLGGTVLWIMTAVAMLCLITLIVVMYRKDMYSGPSTLVDDVRRMRDAVLRDEGGEADRVQERARYDDQQDPSDSDVSDVRDDITNRQKG